jgi:hypothetical protein
VGIKANTSIKAYLMKINGKTPGKKSQGDKSYRHNICKGLHSAQVD